MCGLQQTFNVRRFIGTNVARGVKVNCYAGTCMGHKWSARQSEINGAKIRQKQFLGQMKRNSLSAGILPNKKFTLNSIRSNCSWEIAAQFINKLDSRGHRWNHQNHQQQWRPAGKPTSWLAWMKRCQQSQAMRDFPGESADYKPRVQTPPIPFLLPCCSAC